MKVPAFLLRRLYVKGSLHNIDGGCRFELKNSLGSGYAESVLPLRIDGEEIALHVTAFTVGDETMSFADVSKERPMTLGMSKTVTVTVTGRTLASGKHNIALGFIVVGMGEMVFDVTDVLAEAAVANDAAG